MDIGMGSYLAVAGGGALGSALRFGMQEWMVAQFGRAFPWGTLGVNILGSFLIGVLAVLLVERMELHPAWRLLLVVGVLGGFTTFSTFSLEVVHMLDTDAWARALGYMLASLLTCVFAAAGGLYGTRWVLGVGPVAS
ncbi:fluoride efflux transporter CrcB [Thioalkalivibrio sp.]|uniref:fluoride efflux transporter CrcB n=1 Tax=Thioalkalivibrio sp. TaxID=2093813 RepID=UPI003567FBD1